MIFILSEFFTFLLEILRILLTVAENKKGKETK